MKEVDLAFDVCVSRFPHVVFFGFSCLPRVEVMCTIYFFRRNDYDCRQLPVAAVGISVKSVPICKSAGCALLARYPACSFPIKFARGK